MQHDSPRVCRYLSRVASSWSPLLLHSKSAISSQLIQCPTGAMSVWISFSRWPLKSNLFSLVQARSQVVKLWDLTFTLLKILFNHPLGKQNLRRGDLLARTHPWVCPNPPTKFISAYRPDLVLSSIYDKKFTWEYFLLSKCHMPGYFSLGGFPSPLSS